MPIRIPRREDQTVMQSTPAARPHVSGPVPGAYSAAEAQAMQQVADGLGKVGGVLYDLNRQQEGLNMSAFEADAQLAAKQYADDLANSNDYLSFGQKYNDFEKSIQDLGKTRLGDAAYNRWAATRGKVFMGGIQLDTAQQTAQKKSVALKNELANNLNNWATLASLANTPEAFEKYSEQARTALNEAYAPENGSAPLINEQEKLGLEERFNRAVGEATLTQDIQNKPKEALKNLRNPEMYKFFTPQERQLWINRAQQTEKAIHEQLKKGMNEVDARQFGINKGVVAVRLDLSLDKIKNSKEVNPYDVFSLLNQIDDFTTKAETGYKNRDGSISFYLEPNEAYQYRKEILKYFDALMEKLDNPDKNTYFNYGMEAIDMEWDKQAASHGLNEFDRMDVVQEYYRQMAATVPHMDDRADIAYQPQTMEAAQKAFASFVMRSKKFNEREKNIVLSTPKEIKTRFITGVETLGKVRPGYIGSF